MTYDPTGGYYPPVYTAPAPKPRRRVWPWIVAAFLGLCLLGTALGVTTLGAGVHAVQKENASRTADITPTGCARTVIGTVEVAYTLTNSSSTGRSYYPQFQVKTSDGTIVGQAADITPPIGAGQSFKGKAVGTLDDSARTGFTCVLVSA